MPNFLDSYTPSSLPATHLGTHSKIKFNDVYQFLDGRKRIHQTVFIASLSQIT